MSYQDILDIIRNIISEKGMKQCVIAKKIGFSDAEFSNMLNGRKLLRVEHIPKIASALGVEPNDLFADRETKENCPTK